MGKQYTLICENHSSMDGSFCVFQCDPENNSHAALAWLCKFCHPGVSTKFIWDDQPYFVWCQAKSLNPGTVLFTSQAVAGDPRSANSIGFTKQNGGFQFTSFPQTASGNSLIIQCDATIPHFEAAIGIGMKAQAMCGTSQVVTMASPNMPFSFNLLQKYYIAFGNFEQGKILDLSSLKYTTLPLTQEHPHYIATLTKDNTWKFEMPMEKKKA